MKAETKANEIVRCLCEAGWDAYIVGGAARDILRGEEPLDYDVVTEAPYDVIQTLFHDRKVSVVGASFRVCLVDGVEISTYRKDAGLGLSDKNDRISAAHSIQEDLARRDLTINALAFCPYSGDIVDEYGGLDDLKNRIIKFTGAPKERILEDPCRILRACRFQAKIQGTFDPDTFQALKQYRSLVPQYVAPERIRLELLKALSYEKPSLFLDSLYKIGLLDLISPHLSACYGHEGGPHHNETVDEHIKIVGDCLPAHKPLLRLAGYLHDIGKPATAVFGHEHKVTFINHEKVGAEIAASELEKLKFHLKEIAYIKGLISHHMRSLDHLVTGRAIRRMLKKFHDDGVNWKHWLRLKIADRNGNARKAAYPRHQIKAFVCAVHQELKPSSGSVALSIKDLAIDGRDILNALGIQPGPEVGRLLKGLLERVLDTPELNNRDELLQLAEQLHRNRASKNT